MKSNKFLVYYIIILTGLVWTSCGSTKFVPDGEYLLDETKVTTDVKGISSWEMRSYIDQTPNFKTFEIFKVPLYIYNLSGHDSTKWINKTLRNAGDPPVIYDSTKVDKTVSNLHRIMINKGYVNAQVAPDINLKDKKAKINYKIAAGTPYKINDYSINLDDSILVKEDTLFDLYKSILSKKHLAHDNKIITDSLLIHNTLVEYNSNFDLDVLDKERDRISYLLRRMGYYGINKEYIGFEADTLIESNRVNLNLHIDPFISRGEDNQITTSPHMQYEVTSIDFYVDYNPLKTGNISNYKPSSVYEKNGYRIFYGEKGEYIKPFILLEKCFIKPNSLYDEELSSMTYSALSQLQILRNINISYKEYLEDEQPKLRCVITCIPDKRQGISTELEGTNSGGFFGVGAGVGYTHRNLFKGAELFNIGVKGAYEAITPTFTDFSKNYFEFGAETSVTFPRFLFPFFKKRFRKRQRATTQFNLNYTIQKRPGFFERTILGTGLKYTWFDRNSPLSKHSLDLVDLSYSLIPRSKLDSAFYNSLSAASQRYSFENQFIMSAGYTFSKTTDNTDKKSLKSIYSLRASLETAGNVLSLAALLGSAQKASDGSYEILGTLFAQYARGIVDYSRTYFFDDKNSLAWHVGGGLAFPYGNTKQIPIQKRFFSGGANNVRGWAVRELGPGSFYPESNNRDKNNFYYHSGDIRLDANIEYRSKLFWIIELGAFVDAGNVWTVEDYADQKDGAFKYNKFYKEIALSWGLGLRFDFDFVLIRLDCGWKAYDPSSAPGIDKWPIKAPYKMGKNTAWHIAVGYPF